MVSQAHAFSKTNTETNTRLSDKPIISGERDKVGQYKNFKPGVAVYAESQHSEAEAVRLVLFETSLDNIVKPQPNPQYLLR